jgi:4a-hydroxytetrahydrobiopterin dehydratase
MGRLKVSGKETAHCRSEGDLNQMSNERFNQAQIEVGMQSLHQWTCDFSNASISKEWRFKSYKTAIAMLVKVSELAEHQNHHPEMTSVYTTVRIKLWTHDANGLTSKDFELAVAIDKLVEQEF